MDEQALMLPGSTTRRLVVPPGVSVCSRTPARALRATSVSPSFPSEAPVLQSVTNDPRPALSSARTLDRPTDSPMWSTDAIAARLRWLIAHQDGGDVCAAARRLACPVSRLVRLEQTLNESGADCLLAAAARRYACGAPWLLTGCVQPDPTALRADVRERLARLLLAVASSVVEEFEEAHG